MSIKKKTETLLTKKAILDMPFYILFTLYKKNREKALESISANNKDCKQCIGCTQCVNCIECSDCIESAHLNHCTNCKYCLFCTEQVNKQYMILDEQFSKNEYEQFKQRLLEERKNNNN